MPEQMHGKWERGGVDEELKAFLDMAGKRYGLGLRSMPSRLLRADWRPRTDPKSVVGIVGWVSDRLFPELKDKRPGHGPVLPAR